MKKLTEKEISQLTPDNIIGFNTGARAKGFVQSQQYLGFNQPFDGKLFNLVAVSIIHRGNFYVRDALWEKVLEILHYYGDRAEDGGSVYTFKNCTELLRWLGQKACPQERWLKNRKKA